MTPAERDRDQALARRLAHALRVARQRPRVVYVARPFPPGPAYLTRLTVGALAVAAIRDQLDYSGKHSNFYTDEFDRRGFAATAGVLAGAALATEWSREDETHPEFTAAVDRMNVVNVADGILDGIGQALDLTDPSPNDGVTPTMLSPAEMFDDLSAVGAPTETLTAFANGIGLSTESSSEAMAREFYRSDSLAATAEQVEEPPAKIDQEAAEL